jgi:hypothetical protein
MRRAVTLLIIIVASNVAGAVLSPSPDPFSCFLFTVGILCVAIPSYIAGLRQARRLVRTAVTLVIIVVASFVVAAVLSRPGPFCCFLFLRGAGILCVAIPSYVAGLRQAAGSKERGAVRGHKTLPTSSSFVVGTGRPLQDAQMVGVKDEHEDSRDVRAVGLPDLSTEPQNLLEVRIVFERPRDPIDPAPLGPQAF